MGNRRTAIAFLLLVALVFALQVPAHGEERFGPWKYFAPYYFPPDKCCLGHCFGPDDVLPRYETPPPPMPSYGGDCPNPGMPESMPPMARKRLAVSHPVMGPAAGPGAVRMNQVRPQAVSAQSPEMQSADSVRPRNVSRPNRKQATQPINSGASRFPNSNQSR